MNKGKGVLFFTLGVMSGSIATWYFVKKKYIDIKKEEIESVKKVYAMKDEKRQKDLDNMKKEIAQNAKVKPEISEYLTMLKNTEYNHVDMPRRSGRYPWGVVGDDDLDGLSDDDFEEDEDLDDDIFEEEPIAEKRVAISDLPYVIPPYDFGTLEDYETISLAYYEDHVLTDENNDIIDDIEKTIGVDALTRFGEYENDSVFVRDDRLRCDYEVLLCHQNYYEMIQDRNGYFHS